MFNKCNWIRNKTISFSHSRLIYYFFHILYTIIIILKLCRPMILNIKKLYQRYNIIIQILYLFDFYILIINYILILVKLVHFVTILQILLKCLINLPTKD